MLIQSLGREYLRLFQYKFIKVRQNRRIETNRIFYQQNYLYPYGVYILLSIHFIFYQFDDSQQKVGITKPTEHIIDTTEILVTDPPRYFLRERGQHYDRDIGINAFYLFRFLERITIFNSRHSNYQVITFSG